MVDPDLRASVKRDSVTSPHILRVELGEGDVLDDNARDTVRDLQPLALDDAAAAHTDQRLVGSNSDGSYSSVVVADRHNRCISLVVGTPVVLVNSDLAPAASAPWRASRSACRTLCASEVEGGGENDRQWLRGPQLRHELIGRGGRDGRAGGASSCASTETFRCTRDGLRLCQTDDGGQRRKILHDVLHY